MTQPTETLWPQPDGTPLACREKLRVLAENQAELAQTLKDTFDDAILMGVDETALRTILRDMVDTLKSPKLLPKGGLAD